MADIKINGTVIVAPTGALAYKYADDTSDACWVYTEDSMKTLEGQGAILAYAEGVEEDLGNLYFDTVDECYVRLNRISEMASKDEQKTSWYNQLFTILMYIN